jgi:hypothetical protein
MEEVLYYLELKNQYYEKFYSTTGKFLESARQNRWEDIEFFVDNRERILNIIRSYDFNIAKAFQVLDLSQQDVHLYRTRVKALLDKRADLANKIVALDLELVSRIDEVKSESLRELKKKVESNHDLHSFSTAPLSTRPPKSPKQI